MGRVKSLASKPARLVIPTSSRSTPINKPALAISDGESERAKAIAATALKGCTAIGIWKYRPARQ